MISFNLGPQHPRNKNTKKCLNSYHELDGKIVTAHSNASGSNSSRHSADEQNEHRAFCTNTNSEAHVLSKVTIKTCQGLEKDNILHLAHRNMFLPNDTQL